MAFVFGRGYFICMLAAAEEGLAEKESRREGVRCMQFLVLIFKLPSGLEPFFPSDGFLETGELLGGAPGCEQRSHSHIALGKADSGNFMLLP